MLTTGEREIIMLLRDITEAQLRNNQHQAIQLIILIGILIAVIAHH